MADSEASSDEEVIILASIAYIRRQRRDRKRQRRWWVRPWLERRAHYGAYHQLMKELEVEDPESYNNFVRMDPAHFQSLLTAVEPLLQKQETNMRDSISPAERLAVTLRFLATGDSYQSLCFMYRIGRTTLGKIIPETCTAIVTALKDKYMKVPSTAEEWDIIAAAFEDKWNFPNCVGAIDGKHVAIKAPPNSGSVYFNYKEFNSIILLGVADALYRFVWYDVGANGRNNDAGLLSCTSLAQALEENTLNMPAPRHLPNRDTIKVPYMLVADDAFPLKSHLMKPYPKRGLTDSQRIFNYRLSRARRVVESAFGILVARFRVLAGKMNLPAETATIVTEACVALHNFLRTEKDVKYAQEVEGRVARWYMDNDEARPQFYAGNHNPVFARQVRDELKEYFWGAGQVDWQWDEIDG
ncbi:hypothetical protein ACOMHN_033051 [Nucella lapillus]